MPLIVDFQYFNPKKISICVREYYSVPLQEAEGMQSFFQKREYDSRYLDEVNLS
jgi:hypothetical protein